MMNKCVRIYIQRPVKHCFTIETLYSKFKKLKFLGDVKKFMETGYSMS